MFVKKYLVIIGLAAFGISGVSVIPSPHNPLSFSETDAVSPEPAPLLKKRGGNTADSHEEAYLLEDFSARRLPTPQLKRRGPRPQESTDTGGVVASGSSAMGGEEPGKLLRVRGSRAVRAVGAIKGLASSSERERRQFRRL